MNRSLRRRLILWTTSAVAAIQLVCAIILYRTVSAQLLAEFDQALHDTAKAIASLVERERNDIELEFDPRQMPSFTPGERAEYFQLWNDQRQSLRRSPSLRGMDLPLPADLSPRPAYQFIQLPDGRAGRIVAMQFQPREEGRPRANLPPLIVAVARETAPIDRAGTLVGWLLAAVCGGAMLIAVASMALIIRAGLRPLDRLALQLGTVGGESIGQRIDPAAIPRELLPIVAALNAMLDRLQETLQRERTLTADIAHELRTPLAGLEMAIEVCLTHPRDPADYRQTLQRCLQIARSSHAMVENLLTLARSDAGRLDIVREPVDVVELLRQSWSMLADEAAGRQLSAVWRVPESCRISSDREKVRIILHNLLDNAVSHAPAGSSIRIGVRCGQRATVIRIANPGSRIARSDAPRVFDRFWRGDSSRAHTGRHCGLGLPLSRQLADALGADLSVRCDIGADFRVFVCFAASR